MPGHSALLPNPIFQFVELNEVPLPLYDAVCGLTPSERRVSRCGLLRTARLRGPLIIRCSATDSSHRRRAEILIDDRRKHV